jgi:predicted HTH transcriptional regulator
MELSDLRRLVRQGEGQHLEFKRKAHHPDKISRELVAFANSGGGLLLVGVDDDQTIYGVKFPEEDMFALRNYVEQYCQPALLVRWERIRVNERRAVLALHVEPGEARPYFLWDYGPTERKSAYVRVRDMSIRASRELVSVMRLEQRDQGGALPFGEQERLLLQHLEETTRITLPETQALLRLNKRNTSSMLIRLVRAGLLRIHPTEKGDFFSLRKEAFG